MVIKLKQAKFQPFTSKGTFSNWALNERGKKNVRFWTENWPYLKNNGRYGPRLLFISNRKSHIGFQIMTWKSFTLNDLEGQYYNKKCIGCSVASLARRFYCEKYLQNLRPIFSLFIYTVVIYITWRGDHVHGTLVIYIVWQNDHVRCLLY